MHIQISASSEGWTSSTCTLCCSHTKILSEAPWVLWFLPNTSLILLSQMLVCAQKSLCLAALVTLLTVVFAFDLILLGPQILRASHCRALCLFLPYRVYHVSLTHRLRISGASFLEEDNPFADPPVDLRWQMPIAGSEWVPIMQNIIRVHPSFVRLCITLTVEETLGWCFQLDVVIHEAGFIALSIHWVKNYYGCIFCKGWIILLPSMRLVAEEAEAMMKIIKSCASGHKAIKCRWTEWNLAFPSNPFDLPLPPAAPPPPPEPHITTFWEDQTTVPFTGNLVSCCCLRQRGLDPDSQKMRFCQRRALFSGSLSPLADCGRTFTSIMSYN